MLRLGTILVVGVTLLACASADAAPRPRYKAIAFDYFVLFNADSIVPTVERVFPGKGREVTNLWRNRQFEYAWLRSIRATSCSPRSGGWDAAGAKSFGYPTVWVNRFNQPLEELGVKPDHTVTDLHGLLDIMLK